MTPRFRAFLIHLAISLVILAGILYVVIFIWYPPPFFTADGGWQGVRIMMGVDLVLGPLLTLAVYDPGKGMQRLKVDLWIIALIQLSALSAGAWVVADQRTRMVSFANNRFVSMSQIQIDESGVTDQILAKLKDQRPAMAYVALPEDEKERLGEVMKSMGGTPLFKRGDLFQPLTLENRLKIVEQGYDLKQVGEVIPDLVPIIDKFLDKIGKRSEEVSALPLYCRYSVLSLVLDRHSGEIIDTVDITHDELIASLSYQRRNEKNAQE